MNEAKWKFDSKERYWHWDADGLHGVTKKTRWIEFVCRKRVNELHVREKRDPRDLFKDRYCPECIRIATYHEPTESFRPNESAVIKHVVSKESHPDVYGLERSLDEANFRAKQQEERKITAKFIAWMEDLDTDLKTGIVSLGHVVTLIDGGFCDNEPWKCYAYEDNSLSDPKGLFTRQLKPFLTEDIVVGNIGKILSGKKKGDDVIYHPNELPYRLQDQRRFIIIGIESLSQHRVNFGGNASEATGNDSSLERYPGKGNDKSELRRNEAVNQVCEFATDKQDFGKDLGFFARDNGKYGDLSLADDYGEDSQP